MAFWIEREKILLDSFNKNKKGIGMMMFAAVLAAFGQLCWKLSASQGVFIAIFGLCLYGIGAVLMILAYRFGRVSVLQPILSSNYILSILIGYFVLKESINITKIIGISIIFLGVIMIAGGDD